MYTKNIRAANLYTHTNINLAQVRLPDIPKNIFIFYLIILIKYYTIIMFVNMFLSPLLLDNSAYFAASAIRPCDAMKV